MNSPEDIADAVVAELNAVDWAERFETEPTGSVEFTATRYAVPKFRLEQIATLVVAVCPRKQLYRRKTRGSHRALLVVEIGVLRKLTFGQAEVDELSTLTRLIAEHFLAKPRLTDLPTALVVDDVERELYDEELFRTCDQFTSVVRLPIQEGE